MNAPETVALEAGDGRVIDMRLWAASQSPPAAVVQIFHGLAEHSGRYARFAGDCVARGYSVVAHDHRGHGERCDASQLAHFADRDGWQKVLDDARTVSAELRARFPAAPVVLLGHSMGSYIAQHFVMREQPPLAALILSGSTWPPRLQVRIGGWLARLEMLLHSPQYRSPRLHAMGFGSFNRRFEPARTAFDWLSRDAAEVAAYVSDPLCGTPASAALWRDLLGGLLAISTRRALQRIPPALPILITGGERDPVGGRRGLSALAAAYEASGHDDVTLRVYPGGRHEMLNETNRDEVTADLLAWIGDRL